MKSKQDVAVIMSETFIRLDKLREAGQKEYAHKDSNAFANFDRVGEYLGIERKKVLWTYLQKHLDGIVAHINGHRSQRESVHGRIDDAHVYLELLRAMIIDDESAGLVQESKRVPTIREAATTTCNCADIIKTGPCPTHSLGQPNGTTGVAEGISQSVMG